MKLRVASPIAFVFVCFLCQQGLFGQVVIHVGTQLKPCHDKLVPLIQQKIDFAISDLVIPDNGDTFFASSSNSEVIELSLDDLSVKSKIRSPGSGLVLFTSPRTAADWYAIGGTGLFAKIHRRKSNEVQLTIGESTNRVRYNLASSADGKYLAIAETGQIVFWDTAKWKRIVFEDPKTSRQVSMCFTQDASALLVLELNGEMQLISNPLSQPDKSSRPLWKI